MAKNLQSKQMIAKMFGVTVRRIEQLVSEGIIRSEGRPAKFDLVPTVQSYTKYLADKAYAREAKEQDTDLETAKLKAEVRIKEAKAQKEELELKELLGELHRAEDVESITTDHVLYLRSMLMALPGKLAVDLAGTHTAPEQAERVKKEINYVLSQASEYRYDAEEYKKRVRDRRGWLEKEDSEE